MPWYEFDALFTGAGGRIPGPLDQQACVADAEATGCLRAQTLPGDAYWVARRTG